jgi:hypothetical protein
MYSVREKKMKQIMATTKLNETSTCVYVKKRRRKATRIEEEKQNPTDVF